MGPNYLHDGECRGIGYILAIVLSIIVLFGIGTGFAFYTWLRIPMGWSILVGFISIPAWFKLYTFIGSGPWLR